MRALLRIRAEAILRIVRDGDVVIRRADDLAAAHLSAGIAVGAVFGTGLREVRRVASGGNVVDRTAERGAAVAQGVRAAEDFEILDGERFDGLHVEAAVGEVQRDAIEHQLEAAPVERALNAGATDGEAGFIGAEARLHEDAGDVFEGVLHGGDAARLELRRRDDARAARDGLDLLQRLRGSRHGARGGAGVFLLTGHDDLGQLHSAGRFVRGGLCRQCQRASEERQRRGQQASGGGGTMFRGLFHMFSDWNCRDAGQKWCSVRAD